MGRRAVVVAGLGAAAVAGAAVMLYQIYVGRETVKREEEAACNATNAGAPDVASRGTPREMENQNTITLNDIHSDQLSNLKPILPNHIDSALLTLPTGAQYEVLLQYTPNHTPKSTINHLHATSKLFAKPLGKVYLNSRTSAIVYRADASTVMLVGPSERVAKVRLLCGVLSGCLQALQALRKQNLGFGDLNDLKLAVGVTAGGKAKILGAHGVGFTDVAPSEQHIVTQIALLAESAVACKPEKWGAEGEQARRLCKDLHDMTTVAAAEKRLSLSAGKHR